MFKINPDLNIKDISEQFGKNGKVVVPNFLAQGVAERLSEHLRRHEGWTEIFNSGDSLYELNRSQRSAMSNTQEEQLQISLYNNLRSGFQYRYETIRIPDDRASRIESDDLLSEFALWLSSDAPLKFFQDVTGEECVNFLDAQATAFSPGHYLSGHDDAVVGKNRRAAYVLGLTPIWRTEWGGLLLFHLNDRDVQGIVPGFNQLNLFSVPQMHSVTEVNRAAAFRRYSITGWVRMIP